MAAFDLNAAIEMVDAFHHVSGLCCRLLSVSGKVIYEQGAPPQNECAYLGDLPGPSPACCDIHVRGLFQAERFGGRYIYSCASGLTYFSSPIVSGGAVAGGLVAGPVLLDEVDDCLDNIIEKREIPVSRIRSLRTFLAALPTVAPAQLRYLSLQLFSDTVCISDSSREMLLQKTDALQQRSIGEYVHQIKQGQQSSAYPIETEQALLDAISQGDRANASSLLNELLGHIFFFTEAPETIQTRITELLVLLARAAIRGGAAVPVIFEINHRYMQQLRQLHTQDDVAQWLAQALNRFTALVFDLVDSKHKNMIHRAVSYIQANYGLPLTMAAVADHVGYSHSYFSKIFKEEMGCSFRAYLNLVRVEKSKILLLAGNLPIAQICEVCGFENQSYHCKVFKKLVGVSPDRFRKQSRRINSEREYGL